MTRAARGLTQGNLDQVVPATTRDELGELAESFNAMAQDDPASSGSRGRRNSSGPEDRTGHDRLHSRSGCGHRSNGGGQAPPTRPRAVFLAFCLPPAGPVPWSPPLQLKGPLSLVLDGSSDHVTNNLEQALCLRDNGQEKFFLPRVLSIRDERGRNTRSGDCAFRRDPVPAGRPAQKRHGLDRES